MLRAGRALRAARGPAAASASSSLTSFPSPSTTSRSSSSSSSSSSPSPSAAAPPSPSGKLFDKILIANRGEIACRVMRTARRLGVGTVAVYSDADARAQHVAMADEAYRIGGPASTESYLRADRILEVASRAGAQAVHPGYGFLSENEGFSRACGEAGIAFVGPPPKAIVDMGSKAASKAIMTAAGVPVTPGYWGSDIALPTLQRVARAEVGFPLMIKAVKGGGGKGMRVVRGPDDLPAALEACQREAASSFGSSAVLIERYIERPRHIEFQIFADTHGNAVYLWERDCSVQRRHQKVRGGGRKEGGVGARGGCSLSLSGSRACRSPTTTPATL
jgi:3-methylcrotonyl-CoA carboxylase alpha subunit